MNKLSLKSCPLCGGTHVKHSITCTDFYVSKEQFELFSCSDCEFVFTQGFPVGDGMDKYYETADYISHSDTRKGLVNMLYHRVRKYMLNRKARLVVRESRLSSGRLLDVGTGTGYFPAVMMEHGWKVEAVEKNEKARNFAADKFGLTVRDVDSLTHFAAGAFDAITLWHVMEHLEQADKTWEILHHLLSPDGVLIVAVPNSASYDAKKYREQWAAYDVPRHLWHFTPGTMRKSGEKHDFVLSASYPMPFDAFYVSMLSEKYKGSRFSFVKGMFTGVLAWFHSLADKEQSSSMIYVFRKKQI